MPAALAPRISPRLTIERLRGLETVAAIALICLVISLAAGWHAIAGNRSQSRLAARGTALRARPVTYAAPGAGSTGTAELPDLPIPLDYRPAGDGTVIPARPFYAALASPLDRGRALACLTAAIYYEAASESDDGQRAVAQVILNRVRHPAFPATVCGVVYQGSEKSGCQFSFACDGATARVPLRSGWSRATRIAADALAGYVFRPVGLATHYHTYAVTPAWNRKLVMTAAIGAHFFHRWQGYWGTPAAFNQTYRGGEPLPGPRTPIESTPLASFISAAAPALPATPAMPGSIAAAPTAPVNVQPAYASSGSPLSPAQPPESQILDKWKDSGSPLK